MPSQNDNVGIALPRLFPDLLSYLPLIPLLQTISASTDPKSRAKAILDLAAFGATKTATEVDDKLVALLEETLATEPGGRLATYIADVLTSTVFQAEGQGGAS